MNSSNNSPGKFFNIDWISVSIYIALVFIGWLNVLSATLDYDNTFNFSFDEIYVKQLLWIACSFPIIVFIFTLNSKLYERFASIFYGISLLSLAGLFVLGKTVAGQTCWYEFGGFSIQPSEFAKVATSLAIAKFVSDVQINLRYLNHQIAVMVIIMLPVLLIFFQPDPGSMLVYSILFLVLYREGLPAWYLWAGFFAIFLFYLTLMFDVIYVVGGLSVILLYFVYLYFQQKRARINMPLVLMIFAMLVGYVYSISFVFNNVFKPHHRDRFNILLGKEVDLKGTGYNTNQSEIAIGSGGWFGKGFLEGTQTRGDFVPEQHTDYIFTIVGEEWGFLGAAIVLLLFSGLILRIIYLSEKQKNNFNRIYGYCVAAIFFVHFLINVGMVLGVMPTIGIPLPFFSYGGSGLWSFTVLLFIFLKLDANKIYDW
jgi:rod shape determining protein RodA